MEREKQEYSVSKKRNPIVLAVWSGISIGAISFLLATSGQTSVEGNKPDPSDPVVRSMEFNLRQEEKRIDGLFKKLEFIDKQIVTPTLVPTPEPTPQETPTSPVQNQESQIVQGLVWEGRYKLSGPITYYGIDDGYGLEDTLGCTGEPFDPNDPTTAARPYSSPFKCGDRVRVCDNDSCIEVIIKDSCPGCDSSGKLIDLSYGAMVALTGQAASTNAALEGPIQQ